MEKPIIEYHKHNTDEERYDTADEERDEIPGRPEAGVSSEHPRCDRCGVLYETDRVVDEIAVARPTVGQCQVGEYVHEAESRTENELVEAFALRRLFVDRHRLCLLEDGEPESHEQPVHSARGSCPHGVDARYCRYGQDTRHCHKHNADYLICITTQSNNHFQYFSAAQTIQL